MRALLFVALLACLACGGGRRMGETCEASDECADDGTCLAGVCSGYDCETDDDCENDLVCERVAGVDACVTPCETDDDCLGGQACREGGVCL